MRLYKALLVKPTCLIKSGNKGKKENIYKRNLTN